MNEGMDELEGIRERLTDWEWDVAQVIREIPCRRIITYGCLARITAERDPEHSYSPDASRAVGKLRRKLYRLLPLRHGTQVPLHRIAKQGDLCSRRDSEETREENNRRRDEEGTPRDNSAWWCGEGIVY